MERDVDCMACLTALASGLPDEEERYVDRYRITHAVVQTISYQGLYACEMHDFNARGWIVKNPDTCRVLIRHGGVWS